MLTLTKPIKRLYWKSSNKVRAFSRDVAFNLDLALSGVPPKSGAAASLRQWEIHNRESTTQAMRAGFTIASRDNLARHKTSDTLFVLGSGPSINDISESKWKEIARHDSIGFNYFLAHPFVPTFYHMELLHRDLDMFRSCYSQRRDAYKNIPFMVNYLHIEGELKQPDLNFIHNLLVTVPRRYAGTSASEFHQILEYAYKRIEPKDSSYFVHNRASVSLMVSLAVLLDYKRIVLAGIDLNSTGHFFCDERYACEAVRSLLDLRCQEATEPVSSDGKFLHITADPTLWPNHITIDRSLEIFSESVLKQRGIDLYVYNKGTLLYPAFPIWGGL